MKECIAKNKTYPWDPDVTITNPSCCLLGGPDATNKIDIYRFGLLFYWVWKAMTRSSDERDKEKRRRVLTRVPGPHFQLFGKETR